MFGVLNRRLALLTAISSVIITVVISIAAVSFVRSEEIARVEQNIRVDISSHLRGLTQSLWTYDDALIQAHLDGFLNVPAIDQVRLTATEGDKWTVGGVESDRRSNMSFDVTREIGGSVAKLGTVEVWLDYAVIDGQIRTLALVPLAVVAGTSMVTGVVVLLLFHRLVGKHLRRLAAFLAHAGGDSREQRFGFRRPSSRSTLDELDRIEEALNRMLQTERQLRHTEIELMAAVEHSRDGLALFDADDRLMFTNPEYRRICAVVEDLLVEGTSFETILRAHVERGAVRQAQGCEEEWIRWRLERHRSGTQPFELYFELVGLWIQVMEDRRPGRGVLLVLSDITQYKHLTEELSRHKHHLEDLVEERTKELEAAHDELLRSERLATIGQLTGTVSHELRNPLGTIQSSFAVIRECVGDQDDAVTRACERIDRNIDRCVAIIDELLEYTRDRELARRPAQLDEWLHSVVEELEVPEPVAVQTSFNAGVELPFDKEKLRQAVANVIQNAWQSMVEQSDAGARKELTVTSRVVDGWLEIGVADTGPGIEPDIEARIFEPLFSTRNFGIGLGLPLVKRIVEQHRGELEVDSSPGAGTRMVIRLPLDDGRGEARADETAGAGSATNQATTASSRA